MVKPVQKASANKAMAAKSKADDSFEESGDSLLLDMESVEEQSFETIPKGTYAVIVEETEFRMSATSGKPMWNLTLVITDGEFKGRKVWHIMSFSEGAMPTTKAQLLKFAPEVISARFDPKKIAESGVLNGKKFRVKTKIEAYQGEDRTKIAQVLPAADSDGFDED